MYVLILLTLNVVSQGIGLGNQQVNFKSISFTNCNIGYQALGGFTVLLQSPTFDNVGTCVSLKSCTAITSILRADKILTGRHNQR